MKIKQKSSAGGMSRKRSRELATAPAPPTIILDGGAAEKPRTIANYRGERLCDVELQPSDGGSIHAHRVILASSSDYFASLFTGEGDWTDSTGPLALSLTGAVLRTCCDWIYTGKAEVINETSLGMILEAATYLSIAGLEVATLAALQRRLCATNCVWIWSLADAQGFQTLADAALASASEHFVSVAGSPQWGTTPRALVEKLLANSKLVVPDEEHVYRTCLSWVQAQRPPMAEAEAASLLGLVRFPCLAQDFVRSVVRNEPLLQTPAGTSVLIDALLDATYGVESTHTQRRAPSRLFLIGGQGPDGGEFDNKQSPPVVYDALACKWLPIARMKNEKRCKFAAAAVDGYIYVFGGYGDYEAGGGTLSSMERYDSCRDEWVTLADMPIAMASQAAVALNGQVYVLGGWDDDGTVTNSVWHFDPQRSTWTELPPMAQRRDLFGAAALDGKIYAIGGVGGDEDNEDDVLRTVERFDPVTNAWESVAGMQLERGEFAAVALDGKLFAIGGYCPSLERTERVEVYCPEQNSWTLLEATLEFARDECAGVAFGGKLVVAGGSGLNESAAALASGEESSLALKSVLHYKYNSAANACEQMAADDLPSGVRSSPVAVVI